MSHQAILTNLYYDVRVKGHFEENWTELYPYSDDSRPDLQLQSASENTLISTPQDYPAGGQVDFQVEAIIVTIHPLYNTNFAYWEYETSDWSNTQTLSIPASEPTATPNNSLSPTTSVTTIHTEPSGPQSSALFGLDWEQIAVVVLGVVVVLLVGVVVLQRRRRVK